MKNFSAFSTMIVLALSPQTHAQTLTSIQTHLDLVAQNAPDESIQLDDRVRAQTGGSFVALSDGVVAYKLRDLGGTTLVVLIHGYSAPSFVWDGVVRRLHAAGMSTLTYDLYGHGLSDRPNTTYSRELYDRQLNELLHAVAPDKRLMLAGWSMGAMIAARFATLNANKVDSVLLVSPSGLSIKTGLAGRVAMIPVIGDMGYSFLGGWGLRNIQRAFSENAESYEAYMREFRPQMQYAGFQRAMLSTLRNMNMDDFATEYKAFGQTAIPSRIAWAINDRATPFNHSHMFIKLVPNAVLKPMKGVEHASLYENPDLVYRSLFGEEMN